MSAAGVVRSPVDIHGYLTPATKWSIKIIFSSWSWSQSTRDRDTFKTVVLPFLTKKKFLSPINWFINTWKCQPKDCPKYKSTVSVRTGPVFYNSRLTLEIRVDAVYLWSECIGEAKASRQVGISEKTMNDWLSFFGEVCNHYLQANPVAWSLL